MKTLRVALIITCCIVSLSVSGQSTTYLGVETAATHDLFTFIDEGDLLSSDLLISGYYGITLSQSVGRTFILETGIISKHYLEGYDYELDGPFDMKTFHKTGTSSNAFISMQVPFRVKAEFPIIQDRFSFFSTVGYHLSFRTGGEGTGSGEMKIYSETDTISSSHTARSGLAKTFSLLETGIGLSYHFANQSKLYVTASYFSGFRNIIELDVEYTLYDQPTYTAEGVSTGDYWSIGIGYSYPVGRMR